MHVCQTACHAGSSLSQLHCRPIASCRCCPVVTAPAIPAACHKPLTAKCFRTPKHSSGGFVGSRCCMWLPAGVAAVSLLQPHQHLLCCSQSTAGLCGAAAPRELSQIEVSFARTGGRPGSRAARMCCGSSASKREWPAMQCCPQSTTLPMGTLGAKTNSMLHLCGITEAEVGHSVATPFRKVLSRWCACYSAT
jgi:hypothetical protein